MRTYWIVEDRHGLLCAAEKKDLLLSGFGDYLVRVYDLSEGNISFILSQLRETNKWMDFGVGEIRLHEWMEKND